MSFLKEYLIGICQAIDCENSLIFLCTEISCIMNVLKVEMLRVKYDKYLQNHLFIINFPKLRIDFLFHFVMINDQL